MRIKQFDYDTTESWINEKSNEKGMVHIQNYYIDNFGIKYTVNNNTVRFNHTEYEKRIAKWYAVTKGRNIRMLPEISYPQNIKTGDFIESTNKNYWEIKEPTGNTINTTIPNQFKNQKEKALRFIIDMHLSDMKINVAVNEIKKVLSSKRYSWIEEVILIKNLKLKKVFTKKDKFYPHQMGADRTHQ